MSEHIKIERFISQFVRQTHAIPPSQFVLYRRDGNNEIRIGAWPINATVDWHDEKCEQVAKEINDAASDDSEETLGSYILHAYVGKVQTPEKTLVFGSKLGSNRGGLKPTSEGIVLQLMKLNDRYATLHMQASEKQAHFYERLLEVFAQRAFKAEEKHSEALELLEKLSSMQEEREINRMRASQQGDAIKELTAGAKMILPAIVNHMTGRRLLPENAPGVQSLTELVKSLSQDQLNAILATMSPVQQSTFIQLFSELAKEESNAESNLQEEKADHRNGSGDRPAH